MRKLVSLVSTTVLALSLSACSDSADPDSSDPDESEASESATTQFDPLSIQMVPDIAAMVPETVASTGQLRNGASPHYAPAEFSEGTALTGYNIEIVQALGRVMGLEGTTRSADFPTILGAVGTRFDIGVSSFTISQERLEKVNMISYLEVGSAFAVAKGNPSDFDPENPCGSTIGVQTGSYQQDLATGWSAKCVEDGEEPVEVVPLELQKDINAEVVEGTLDATFADSPVISYAVAGSSGKLQEIGKVIESQPQGIAVAQDDEQLTVAVQAAMQHLMDEGYLDAIMVSYGAEDCALSQSEINPGKK